MRDKNIESLGRMLRAINKIKKYCENQTLDMFLSNEMLMDACAVNILTLGEEAKRINPDYRKQHPQINWKGLYELRNVIAHEYYSDDVDFEVFWDLIQNDLEPLKKQITNILPPDNDPTLDDTNKDDNDDIGMLDRE